MDIIKFDVEDPPNPIFRTKLEQGSVVNNIKKKMWIERYEKEGEFQLFAEANTKIREELPIGSIITHTDTTELMIVENHEINVTRGQPSQIIISGRGFETFFENRIVGSNKNLPYSGEPSDYVLQADYTWNQIVVLLDDHVADNVVDIDNEIPYIVNMTSMSGTGVTIERSLQKGTLYQRLLELLDIDSLGIKVIRPGIWSPLGLEDPPRILVLIHNGVDRSNEVIFSYDTGEIQSADYLWSNKKLKNAAFITGKWVETFIGDPSTGYDRRIMYIDASDIDGDLQTAPTGTLLNQIVDAMQQRGVEILTSQNEVVLAKAEVSREANKLAYRTDFNVGDLVTVRGDYNETSYMRISEYVEIEDEEGRSGYPTLTM